MKRPYTDLMPDGNAPGLRVCKEGCWDSLDPYRLPARRTEDIAMQFPRPDAKLDNTDVGLSEEEGAAENNEIYITTEDGDILQP